VPRFFGNKVNMKYLLFSRASEAFFGYHRKTVGEKILHSIGKPMVWMQWRGLEALLKWQYDLKKCDMLPAHRIDDQISCSLGVEPVGFYKKVKDGSIRVDQKQHSEFYKGWGVAGEPAESERGCCHLRNRFPAGN
jgi:dimethylaniline monooxygenase (N-oxide forming)